MSVEKGSIEKPIDLYINGTARITKKSCAAPKSTNLQL